MPQTAFLHRRHHNNIGDLACSPGNYFDLGPHQFFDFTDDVPQCDLMILGGGQVFQDCVTACIKNLETAQKRIVWGVGISAKDRRSFEYDLLEGATDLVSTRNWGIEGCDFVPCPTAMSPLFDTAPEPTQDVVLFAHAKKSQNLQTDPGIPQLSNNIATMAEAIDFIASGATVVTNSYHGTYWAMCLGRKVLCLPFSDKFRQFQHNPIEADPTQWLPWIQKAESRPDTLKHARIANQYFYEKVRNLM